MATNPMPKLRHNGRPAGEPLVWLTSMGLAVALAMAVCLFGLIAYNGAGVFWPKRLTAYTINPDGKHEVLVGELVNDRERSDGGGREIQIYLANKDALGNSFRFVAAGTIINTEQPNDLMRIERMADGPAIGVPVSLSDGATTLLASDPTFVTKLQQLIDDGATRRDELRHLERNVIGANSREINQQKTKLTTAQRAANPEAIATAETTLARLDSEFQKLDAQAMALRNQHGNDRLTLRLGDGTLRKLPIGAPENGLLSFRFPNQLGFFARLSAMASNGWHFLADNPRESNTDGGIFPAIFGTFVMTLMMSCAVTPFGVLAAIYLREYARQGFFVRAVRVAINNLAGVPSIVFGVFGLGFFVYGVGGSIDELFYADSLPTPTYGTGGLIWAAATLALMPVPVVIVATEESIAAVPRGAREGSIALGASKWQTIRSIVLPAAIPGILTGLILAMARGAGEVAPLMLVGVVKSAPSLPVDGLWNSTDIIPFIHLDQKFMHLGFHIYDLGFQSPDSDAAKPMVFATTFLLILLVLALNLGAIILRDRLRKKYASATF
ncbi:MAG: phosphate ABC transporter permease PstA [Planctomycetota bacterium]